MKPMRQSLQITQPVALEVRGMPEDNGDSVVDVRTWEEPPDGSFKDAVAVAEGSVDILSSSETGAAPARTYSVEEDRLIVSTERGGFDVEARVPFQPAD